MTETLEAAPEAHDDHPHLVGLRAQRRHRRERRIRIAIAFLAALVIVAALGAFGYTRLRGEDTKLAAAVPSTVVAHGVAQPAEEPATTRPLTADNPLRLWIAGDSLAGALGPSLGEITGATGVVQPQFDSRVSSGLESNAIINWPDHAADEIARLNPEVIVFIIGTNDYPVGLSKDMAEYEQKVDTMMRILAAGDRPVYWVGPPVLRDARMNKGAAAVNEVFGRLAPKHRSITFVDAYKVFSNADGKYAPSLPDDTGKTVNVRAGDGVHFTDAGGDRLAGVVFDLMDQVWNIRAQAVAGVTKPVLETPGSSRVPVNQGRRTTPAPSGTRRTPGTTAAPSTTADATETTAAPTTAATTTTTGSSSGGGSSTTSTTTGAPGG